jgi:uncharacterized protein YdeI (YjbR/CyaY-like superfamily)
MAGTGKNRKVDSVLSKATEWREEFELLRKIALGCGLTEELKWGCPCYSLGEKNIVLVHGFKGYCALLFFKGALLIDPDGTLIRQTKNVQAARQLRFRNAGEIMEKKSLVKSYIKEAIEAEKAGLKVKYKETAEFTVPEEFQIRLDENPALKKAFAALTPGRQRAYILYFSAPKQSITRESRVERSIPQILKGIGLHDRT